jgi:hypothetical protein
MRHMRSLLFTLSLISLSVLAPAQNSGKKLRSSPSELASKAGSAVEWRTDLKSALEEAEREKKPVFWYLPTIRRSPMDRKVEVDRYMMAGPFSWPRVTALLNEHFIPVRMVAGKEECEAHGLKPLVFVEPGWIVLDQAGEELGREHQITTFHPGRFIEPLAQLCEETNAALDGLPGSKSDPATALWLSGVKHWISQAEEEARADWTKLTEAHPDHPLAWKAAMELEGHGPFVHAFETYAKLSPEALAPSADGTTALAGAYSEEQLWERSVAFLLGSQRSHGGWEDSTYDFGGTDGLPNVFVSVSSICTIGLLEHAARLDKPDPAVEAALKRALEYICDESKINRQDTDEQFWAHAYLARALSRWIELRPADKERVTPTLERATADLISTQGKSGAWAHEYSNPFVTSDALVALSAAKQVGVIPEDLPVAIERGVASLLICRTAEGAYSYNQPRRGKARAAVEGSVGRTPRGELALMLWSPEDSIGLEKAVALSFDNEEHLLPAQKYDDHTSSYAYGGFFFYYDLLARTEAIAALAKSDARQLSADRQHAQLMSLPEFDGAFMDSHEIGRCYGTGMALWCLATLSSMK